MTAVTTERSPLQRAGVAVPAPSAVSQGMRDVAPFALSVVPFAVAIGAETAAVGHSIGAGLASGVFLLAGASQLAILGLLDEGAGVGAAVLTAVLLNLRFALFSAGLSRWFRGESLRFRLGLGLMVVDQTYLLSAKTFGEKPDATPQWRRRYYVAAWTVLAAAFLGAQPLGYVVGDSLPGAAGLELAAPLAFMGMLGSALRQRRELVTAGAAVTAVAVLAAAPAGLVIPLAAIAGMVAGSAVKAR